MEYEAIRDQLRKIMGSGDMGAPALAEARARKELDQANTRRDMGMVMQMLAQVVGMQGRTGEAVELFRAALQMVDRPSDRLEVLNGYGELVSTAHLVSLAGAVRNDMLGLVESCAAELAGNLPWAYVTVTQLSCLLGEAEVALQHSKTAVKEAERLGAALAEAYRAQAEAQEATGDLTAALASWQECMVHLRNGHCLMEARAEHSRLSIAVGDIPSAVKSLRYAVEVPDWRDRRVLSVVLRSISMLISHDPAAAKQLTDVLAAHLETGQVGARGR